MEVNLIADLRLEVSRIQDVIGDNPTSVNPEPVLKALENYSRALEKKQNELLRRAGVYNSRVSRIIGENTFKRI